jgi:hypothetical protein
MPFRSLQVRFRHQCGDDSGVGFRQAEFYQRFLNEGLQPGKGDDRFGLQDSYSGFSDGAGALTRPVRLDGS